MFLIERMPWEYNSLCALPLSEGRVGTRQVRKVKDVHNSEIDAEASSVSNGNLPQASKPIEIIFSLDSRNADTGWRLS